MAPNAPHAALALTGPVINRNVVVFVPYAEFPTVEIPMPTFPPAAVALTCLAMAAAFFGGCDCQSPTADQAPPPVQPSDPIAAEDFADELKDAACGAYRQCSNEVFRGGVFHLFALPVGSSFDDDLPMDVVDEFRDEYDALTDRVDAMEPPTLPEEDCELFVDLAIIMMGLDADALTEAIDEERLSYDPELAGQCIERIATPPRLCDQERQARGSDFNMQQYRALARRDESNLEEHYEVCTEVFEGHLEEEESCTNIFECDPGLCEWRVDQPTGHCGPDRRTFWLIP